LVYFPVPKIACTSIKEAILRHNDPEAFEALTDLEELHIRYYPTPRWGEEWRRFFRYVSRPFCVVRDPIDRFVSGYRNRVVFYKNFGHVPDINDFSLKLSAQCAADSTYIDHHFTPMVGFVGRKPSFYARVFRWNELQEIPRYAGLPRLKRRQDGGPNMNRSDLSNEAIEHLKAFYAEDYRVWGAFF
jgi:hypothetical protein